MTKVTLMNNPGKQNRSLMTLLKMMYYFGYLPISWVSTKDPEYCEIAFRISIWKTILMLIFDLLLSLLIPTYFYLFHVLNKDENFDLRQLWSPSYYISLNDGIMTTTFSQMLQAIFVMGLGGIHSFTGELFLSDCFSDILSK